MSIALQQRISRTYQPLDAGPGEDDGLAPARRPLRRSSASAAANDRRRRRRSWWTFLVCCLSVPSVVRDALFRGNRVTVLPRTILVPVDRQAASYPPNTVRNQKYNLISFLPIVLYEQFKFFFNLYFLLVALSQFVPALKIGYLFTYFAPLAFVLAVTIGKEALDDYKRYKRDKEANSQLYRKLTPQGAESIPSSQIRVGDLIYISKDQRVPADCILLRTEDASGTCFIRTDQLDGETDWKLRIAVPMCQKLPADDSLLDLRLSIYADRPMKDIHTFLGNISKNSDISETQPLTVDNTLWSNTVVASGLVLGAVVYTGRETRAVMNTSFPKTKVGLLDLEINRLAKILAFVTLLLSAAMVVLNGLKGLWYVYLFRFLILFSSIIPISLRVNLDMGKTVYSMQIMSDKKIPDTIVRTSTIPEELGRIEYVLTDKTGTLTKNEMELKRLHMGTMSFGVDSMDDVRVHLQTALQSQNETNFVGYRPKRGRDISSRVLDIVTTLALCHNVTPVVSLDGITTYQAASPDEVAIVKWTSTVGVTLHKRSLTHIHLQVSDRLLGDSKTTPATSAPSATAKDQLLSYQILNVFPFTSETKRMGIIVRSEATREIWFLVKGADGVMARLVRYNDWLEEECGNMAREGLRTLVIARRRLSEEEYSDFDRRYNAAQISTSERAELTRAAIGGIERELELLGLTGVEDKLQDEVKISLELLRNAGIKIWMLTGDKIETASCIAVSSKLVARNQSIHTISKVSDPTRALDELDILRSKGDVALIVDGESLHTFTQYHVETFTRCALTLPVVVCCRCSPTQKAEITSIIRQYTGRRVLAIGDGGNDVSMIQAADIGVGIVGKEGRQASLAADFSVTQFSFITRLMLWHGRNSYKRSAKLSQFVIHRGLIISVMQAVFSAIFYFAPLPLYQGWLLVGYATIYTMAPVFSLVLDKDLTEETALLYPELYKELRKGRSLSYRTFFTWLLISVYQGGAIMILSLWLFEDEFVNVVAISFTALVFNELLMVALEIVTWHPLMVWSEIMTVAVYIGSMFWLKTDFDMQFILTWVFVWKVAIITSVSSLPLYLIKYLRSVHSPAIYRKLQG
ncbi:phospholipid-translocating P-type ATPase [Zopfochytrium polystomum]|nr:phospholipid-translocating P-type ATPase [Zopfochytrium polystomum]